MKLKKSIKKNFSRLLFIITLILFTLSCNYKTYWKYEPIVKYGRNLRYEKDSIILRSDNRFTRKKYKIGLDKFFFGIYSTSNDTIYFDYQGKNEPENEFFCGIMKDSSLFILLKYERIKEQYGYLSASELDKIDKKDLMTIDTTLIEFRKENIK